MPISRRFFVNGALIVSVLVVIAIFIVPTSYKMGLLFGLYLVVLLFGLGYYQTYRRILDKIKTLDREEAFAKLIIYLNQVESKGYGGFVYDSYRLYALYVLGDFTSYQKTAAKMTNYRAWSRPKNKAFREKVIDNLACIDFLEKWADENRLDYQGNNVLIIQSIVDYKEKNFLAIQSRLEAYELPQLKKACLLALSGQFEAVEKIYLENELFKKVKEVFYSSQIFIPK